MRITASLRNSPVAMHPALVATLRAALGMALTTLLLFGLAYSVLTAGLGRLLFPYTATGSLLERDGRIVGSALVAQPFADAGYFSPRPSASGHDAMTLSGSNQARTNPALHARVATTRAALAAREGVAIMAVPADLATQSGSGIDPDISPAAAQIQIARVAQARRLRPEVVEQLVQTHIEPRQFGLLGQPRVNVLELNLALDALDQRIRVGESPTTFLRKDSGAASRPTRR